MSAVKRPDVADALQPVQHAAEAGLPGAQSSNFCIQLFALSGICSVPLGRCA
jgi:hypothetical protein